MEDEFIVRTHSEGTVPSNRDIDAIISSMGCQSFGDRLLGTVKAVVEKSGGTITKKKLVWGEDNDPKFNTSQQKNADAVLEAAVKAVNGGGDPSELIIKFVVKK